MNKHGISVKVINRISLVACGLACLLLAETLPSLADEGNMQKGIAEFNAGAYTEALGHLQAALATDYQNPKLHYYLANTFVHLNRKEAGVREYRIAYALDPDKEVGKLSKQALSILGADESKAKDTPKTPDKTQSSDPVFDKLSATLQQQAEQARSLDRSRGELAGEMARRNNELLGRSKQDLLRDMSYYRRGRLIQLPLPDDALKQLDSLKRMYEAQKNSNLDGAARHSDEIQKTADNLSDLLKDKGKAGSPKLVPEGTNLYIRNYKNDAGKPAAVPEPAKPAK